MDDPKILMDDAKILMDGLLQEESETLRFLAHHG
jgi:hypothetical protein